MDAKYAVDETTMITNGRVIRRSGARDSSAERVVTGWSNHVRTAEIPPCDRGGQRHAQSLTDAR
jgi:hypothetical protein